MSLSDYCLIYSLGPRQLTANDLALRQPGYSLLYQPGGQPKSNEDLEHTQVAANRLRSVAKIGWRINKRSSRQQKNKREIKLRLQLSALVAQIGC